MPKQYEILITHKEGEPCPTLPPGLSYLPESEYGGWHCPTHLVYQAAVPIWKVRQIIEKQLFYVRGIERISLYYGGIRKLNDCYERDKLIERQWKHTY